MNTLKYHERLCLFSDALRPLPRGQTTNALLFCGNHSAPGGGQRRIVSERDGLSPALQREIPTNQPCCMSTDVPHISRYVQRANHTSANINTIVRPPQSQPSKKGVSLWRVSMAVQWRPRQPPHVQIISRNSPCQGMMYYAILPRPQFLRELQRPLTLRVQLIGI